MIDTPPAMPNTQPVQEHEQLRADLQELSREDMSDHFKDLRLRHYIEKIIAKNERHGINTGVSITDLRTGKAIVGYKLDTEQFAASVNKLPIVQLVLNDVRAGRLGFAQVLTWQASDVRAGRGVFDQQGAPLQATVKDLMFDVLNPSGNTAIRVLVNQGLGGAAGVNTRFVGELDLQHTYLQPLDSNRFFLGNSTARESLKVLRQLLVAQDQYGAFVRQALATNVYTDYGVRSQLAGNDYIVLANKVGILDDVEGNNRHDVGIIYNTHTHRSYGYSFMNTAMGEPYNAATAQAGVSLADMGSGLLRHAGDKSASTIRTFNAGLAAEQRVRY